MGLSNAAAGKPAIIAQGAMLRVGIDENGLGARLGPLVVTAVAAEVAAEAGSKFDAGKMAVNQPLLGDSKQLIAHGDVRLGEAWARVLTGGRAATPAELLESITSIPTQTLRLRCPGNAGLQCWNNKKERFKAPEYLVADVRRVLTKLQRRGVRPINVRSRLVCTSELNSRGALGENRFLVDLHCMEELIVELCKASRGPTTVVCGKVGGMHEYTRHFAQLNAQNPVVALESKAISVYRIASLAEVRFVRDADGTDPLVMLASLVGKYVRELFVERISTHFASQLSTLRAPSGYHDPVTAEFADATAPLRGASHFPDTCFERASRRAT